MKLFQTWKTVMFDPLVFYKNLQKKNSYKESSIFFLKIQAITLGTLYLIAIFVGLSITFIVDIFGTDALIISESLVGIILLLALLLYPSLLLFSWGMLFVSSGVTHLLVLIFGGKQGYVETFKTVAYSMAPSVFSFIPMVNWAAGIYTLVLQVIGIKHRQKLSWGKSVVVVLIPPTIFFVLIVAIYYTLIIIGVTANTLATGGAQ